MRSNLDYLGSNFINNAYSAPITVQFQCTMNPTTSLHLTSEQKMNLLISEALPY
jgi:hypothetical protein